jgi:uncharacterized repeat protein (TIGR01451 family)
MKKLYLLIALSFLSTFAFAQSGPTIAIQYYVDANSNCSFDSGEQIYNVPTSISYSTMSGTVPIATAVNSPSFTTCQSQTLYCWNPSATPINTINILAAGITKNTCGTFNNLAYNSNTTYYLPVILSGTSNLGVQMNVLNYYSTAGGSNYQNVMSGSTIGLCSNFGLDSIQMSFNIHNLFTCSNSNTMSPRTYSFFLDNVMYDKFTITGGLNSSNSAMGINTMVNGWEYYASGSTYLNIFPDLPATFSVIGTHTFEVKSSMIYNNSASVVNYKCYINSVPCAKISGKFYNDCNNNCTFDAGDSYGVGNYATGLLYNSSGVNVTFHPNPWNGNFSIFMPATSAYSLTQFPSAGSIGIFTACTTGTTTILASATTNTFMFGYKNSLPANGDPGVYLWRTSSTSSIISPLVGATFAYQFNNWMLNVLCSNNQVNNPGKLKITLPKFINYVSTLSGPTPTLSAGTTVDTLIYTIPNFSNTSNWWTNPVGTFSATVSSTAVANTQFAITAYIYPTVDANPLNNIYQWVRTVGGPFDPNGKYNYTPLKLANGDIPFGTQTFIYEIGFQNIGNAPAMNVTTLDTIDSNFDLTSIRIQQSSYPVSLQTDHVSRTVGFHFKGIYLPGAQVNEPASHGFVRYSINLKPGVKVNTVLKNRAHNYFDFLEPVATNQTNNKLVAQAAINERGEIVTTVKAIPNPFNSTLRIESSEVLSGIQVFNLSGQLIIDLNGEPVINMENHPAGVYLIKVSSKTGNTSFIKVVKQ